MVDQVELGWQPIETAPECVDFLAVYPPDGKGVLRPRYGVCSKSPIAGGLLFDWGWAFSPTHWMPLPDPPHPNNTGEV